ncbi:MAG: S-layer homology domain-containing protein [bacterium]|nr:S-layer homology domain-containing protein [bacterium]
MNGKSICIQAKDEAGNSAYQMTRPITGIDQTTPEAPALTNQTWRRNREIATPYVLPHINQKGENLSIVQVAPLPEGLIFENGMIKGKPTKTGKTEVKVIYANAVGNQVEVTFEIKITSSSGSSGGGGASLRDYCPAGDYSGNAYDGVCGTAPVKDSNPAVVSESSQGVTDQPKAEEKPAPEQPKSEESPLELAPEAVSKSDQNLAISYAPEELYNPSIVDGMCYTRRPYQGIQDSLTLVTSDEFKKALSFLWTYEMTMFDSVDGYDPYRNLTRAEAAKMFSQFAMNVLCRKPDLNLHINYSDTRAIDPSLKPYIELAYQLGVMKGSGNGDGQFRPFDYISKAEVNAVLIRMILKSYLDEGSALWYEKYNEASTKLGIITQGADYQAVSRHNVALMLFRAYKEQVFDWKEIDYFSFVLDKRSLFL